MKLILDTHTLIWAISNPMKLPKNILEIISDKKNEIYISWISFFEISIKRSIGKLDLKHSTDEIYRTLADNGVKMLHFTPQQFAIYEQLPLHHRDPFDRILIAQAMAENMTIITKDANFSLYKADILF